ncbi:MAG TPA: protein kinase, partial [Kofleriaceae bacterium]|nr:protein kinase [Kofleriaceae bacterium]
MVYEAEDQLRGIRVALKTLSKADGNLLYRLKREFRSLRDVVHRNLISLDELFEEDGHWFFTMELIDGGTLTAYLHRNALAPAAPGMDVTSGLLPAGYEEMSTETGPRTPGLRPQVPAPRYTRDARPARQLDFERVRSVFGQITEGVLAIHAAGMIHRDLKPSNVMVTKDGRVVILDFGLVTEVRPDAQSREGHIVGTPAYMAP